MHAVVPFPVRWTSSLAGAGLVVALAMPGCGAERDAAQAADAPIGIETSQLGVTIENRAGAALVNVNVSIIGSLTFSKAVPRIENAQRLALGINEFTAPDGTHLNLRAANPRTVRVTATDVANKAYDEQTAWR